MLGSFFCDTKATGGPFSVCRLASFSPREIPFSHYRSSLLTFSSSLEVPTLFNVESYYSLVKRVSSTYYFPVSAT